MHKRGSAHAVVFGSENIPANRCVCQTGALLDEQVAPANVRALRSPKVCDGELGIGTLARNEHIGRLQVPVKDTEAVLGAAQRSKQLVGPRCTRQPAWAPAQQTWACQLCATLQRCERPAF